MKQGYVYILTNKPNGTLYIGVTSDLPKRIAEHKAKLVKGFSTKYGLDTLVYYEVADSIEAAILREKQMKEWRRAWKIRRILETNPEWRDLFAEICK